MQSTTSTTTSCAAAVVRSLHCLPLLLRCVSALDANLQCSCAAGRCTERAPCVALSTYQRPSWQAQLAAQRQTAVLVDEAAGPRAESGKELLQRLVYMRAYTIPTYGLHGNPERGTSRAEEVRVSCYHLSDSLRESGTCVALLLRSVLTMGQVDSVDCGYSGV